MDSLSLMRAIREREDSRLLPVIMLTPHMGHSDNRQASSPDVHDYLYKPITQQRLLEVLTAILRPTSSTASVVGISVGEGKPIHRPLRILLAEDLEDNRAVVRLFLKDMPYVIEEAENGSIAVKKFQEGACDLVFMDLQMPVMDGLMATAAIRAWEQDQQRDPTPVIAITANALREDLAKSLAAGCIAHLTKPIKKKTLLAAIVQYTKAPSDLAA